MTESTTGTTMHELLTAAIDSGQRLVVIPGTDGRPRMVVTTDPGDARKVLLSGDYSVLTGPKAWFAEHVAPHGLLVTEGDPWRVQRRLLDPLFASPEWMDDTITECVAAAVEQLEGYADTGEPVDLTAMMSRLLLAITAGGLFGVAGQDLTTAIEDVTAVLDTVTTLLPSAGRARESGAVEALRTVVARRIDDLAPDEHGPVLRALLTVPGDDDRALIDQIVTLLLAGFETTASTVTWAWVHLMRHEQLYRHWRRLVCTGDPDADAMTAAILDETLRDTPASWLIGRTARHDTRLGDITIPAGCPVTTSPWLIHHHPRHWDTPSVFDPGRFLSGPPPRRAWLPFGAGRRYCLGARLARREALVVLTGLATRFTFQLLSDDLRPRYQFVLRPPVVHVSVHTE
ncbi:cytochrome P450 [Nocardia sp. alder85J]|uniref:cytochrome P450 n=1 Tax=Nocardia sp. alder85J TaxID=2862949 RepID=UPI001CD6C4B6|nr:cytochrome P450 [Nocardia sp. alder85J]MCX4097688.1 cytochrome P450 [Nocardia sp. alder85J]